MTDSARMSSVAPRPSLTGKCIIARIQAERSVNFNWIARMSNVRQLRHYFSGTCGTTTRRVIGHVFTLVRRYSYDSRETASSSQAMPSQRPLGYFNASFLLTARNVRLHSCLMLLSVGLEPAGGGRAPSGTNSKPSLYTQLQTS